KDDALPLMVPSDNDRPWSLSSAWGDSSFGSVETANESTNGWTIADASHWSLARVVVYWSQMYGFYPLRNGPRDTWTVIGPREVYEIYDESYATACPGGMDLNLVTARAQQILAGGSPPADNLVRRYPEGVDMYVTGTSDTKTVYAVFTDA